MTESEATRKRKSETSTLITCPIVFGKVLTIFIKISSNNPNIFVTELTVGSAAIHLGKKSDESATHRWKLYIRGPNNEDLASFVQKVAFTLHPSFAEPVRGAIFCS